jgi:6-pyruvoyltetrahydropterin/6-carboxytetrahydropterin synthase
MPFRICKTLEIENGHMLSKHPDRCRYPHGHTRKVELILEADELDANDMVCDFKVLKDAVKEYADSLDHAMCVNTRDPQYAVLKPIYGDRVIGFDGTDPTTEVLARAIHDVLKANLARYAAQARSSFAVSKSVRIARVRVWETSSSWAEYSEKT